VRATTVFIAREVSGGMAVAGSIGHRKGRSGVPLDLRGKLGIASSSEDIQRTVFGRWPRERRAWMSYKNVSGATHETVMRDETNVNGSLDHPG
jgi:hypothetical protein